MAIPGLAAAAGSDKGKRFLTGFTDFLTSGGRKAREVLARN